MTNLSAQPQHPLQHDHYFSPREIRENNIRLSIIKFAFLMLVFRVVAAIVRPFIGVNITAPITIAILGLILLVFLSRPFRIGEFKYAFFGFVGLIFASIMSFIVANPPIIFLSIDFLMRIILLTLWFVFSITYLNSMQAIKYLDRFIKFIMISGALISIVQYYGLPNMFTFGGHTRAFGVTSHPVTFGMLMFTCIMLQEFFAAKRGQPRTRFHRFVTLCGLIGMALAIAQTAWLMLAVAILVLSLQRFAMSLRVIVLPILLVLSLLALYSIPWTRDLFSFFSIFAKLGEISTETYSYELVDNSVSWRVVNWKMSVDAMLPVWYSGLGPGHAEYFNYFGLTLHSMPLEILVETGVFGLISLCFILLHLWISIAKKSKDHDEHDIKARRFAVACAAGILFAGLLSVSLVDQSINLMLFLSMVVISRIPRSKLRAV